MKAEIINFTLTNKSVSIEARWAFGEDDENENGTLEFQNPVSGQWSTDIANVLVGWSEQDDSINQLWGELVDLASEFCNNSELYYIVHDGCSNEVSEYV